VQAEWIERPLANASVSGSRISSDRGVRTLRHTLLTVPLDGPDKADTFVPQDCQIPHPLTRISGFLNGLSWSAARLAAISQKF
jgi:hypothetical protein